MRGDARATACEIYFNSLNNYTKALAFALTLAHDLARKYVQREREQGRDGEMEETCGSHSELAVLTIASCM